MTQHSLFDDQPAAAQAGAPDWVPTRAAGLARLQAFLPHAGRAYASTRNHDYGPARRNNISCLSPWVRHRLLREEEVLRGVLKRYSLSTADKFVQEVFWRSYFKGYLEQHPDIWADYQQGLDQALENLAGNSGLRGAVEQAWAGQTGIGCFDAWVQELTETGYLHNHARMWFASIWIFTLKLPWVLGADFFYRHLLDGDAASNTLSWRWVGGLHTKGKTYLARASNIEKYTDGRFAPATGLADEAPALDETLPAPFRAFVPPPAPKVDAPFVLLVTEEDCQPQSLSLPFAPAAVIGLVATDTRSPLPVGARAKDFAQGAVVDAVEVVAAEGEIISQVSTRDDWATALMEMATRAGANIVVTAYAPVGPVADKLAGVATILADNGITLVQLLRDYDSACWPHARKGFFGLKKKIPVLAAELGLCG
ncbi:FAD-binding domain-containing protein [Parvularcula sp. IMCC14364]|uniref:FAD-binding domain-containing protein n=1 Tax=Parvularcula sp. IMCC14364 TaxID=3067902 RepID=UPI0027423513|nr:FAD-binding domain-containing protein [Parvularcula sp. IMCC14364]